jgi:site-specific DNA recombinase
MTRGRRAAIYARFSSDLQRDRSIEDQIALCREYAARNGYEIVAAFEDRAITGASLQLRAGIQALLRAARSGGFEFVIAESLSRIARDQEDAPAIRKRLVFAGVQIVTTTDGVVTPLLHGLRTIIDSQFLDDLKGAVRRGMAGVVRDGRHPGGLTYGYRPTVKPGEPEIVPEHAEIVRRIFREYIAGETPRSIAAKLNAEMVPPPRGIYWRASTIGGHTARKTGILQNELYRGRVLWNRAYTPRDPDTGARVRRSKPEAEWHRGQVPQLRIIDDETFEAAQHRRAQRALQGPRGRIRPKRILSGLLRCGVCGAGMSKKDTDHGRPRLICTQRREAGACSHHRVYFLDEIERIVVSGIRKELGSREAIAYFVHCYNEARRQSSAETGRLELEVRLENIDRQLARAVAAVIQGRITDAEAERHLPTLRRERDQVLAELSVLGAPPKIVALRPAAIDEYLRGLDRLHELINADLAAGASEAATVIRNIIETVTVMPTPPGRPPGLKVQGSLDLLVGRDPIYVGGAGGAG